MLPVCLKDFGPTKAEHFVRLKVYHSKPEVPPLRSSWYKKNHGAISMLHRQSKWFLISIEMIKLIYLSANWTNPHRLPCGIFTWTKSPYCPKTCLKWSSVTLGSKLPTKICNKKDKSQTSTREVISILQRSTHSCIIWIILVLWPLRILIWRCMFKVHMK